MTSSNGNIFHVTGHLWGEFTGHQWIPHTRPVTWSFDGFFDLRLNKWLSKQLWGSRLLSLWHHCNDFALILVACMSQTSHDKRHLICSWFISAWDIKAYQILICFCWCMAQALTEYQSWHEITVWKIKFIFIVHKYHVYFSVHTKTQVQQEQLMC